MVPRETSQFCLLVGLMGKKLNVSLGTIHLMYIDIVRRNYKLISSVMIETKKIPYVI